MLHPIDIINKNNQLTGEISDPEEANNRGLWHRGVHVIIYTPDGKILIQKRSAKMKFHPGVIDIGVGGYVDSGETIETAAVREVHEETGLTIAPDQLKFVGLVRYNHHWKYNARRKINRTIIHNFIYRYPDSKEHFTTQKSEVEWVKFIPLRSVQHLIHRHFLQRLGILSPQYSYYRRLVKAVAVTLRKDHDA